MNRRLGELFRAAESGASAIAAAGTARDFRPITEARMTSFPSLEPVGESGEIKWGTLSEEGERLAIASFARAIGVTFNVVVNDDLGAIDRSIRDTAFAAALNATLADTLPLFNAAQGNLAASGAPPDETTLSAGRVAMAKQVPPGSTEPLGISPAILLVPIANHGREARHHDQPDRHRRCERLRQPAASRRRASFHIGRRLVPVRRARHLSDDQVFDVERL
jgi:hypothetical protein